MVNHDSPKIARYHGMSTLEYQYNAMFYRATREAFTHSSIKDVCKKKEQDVMSIDKMLTYRSIIIVDLSKLPNY